jgi:hypothetical protein
MSLRFIKPLVATLALAAVGVSTVGADNAAVAKKTWAVKADYIEACSCNLFCQCYFATGPEGGEFCEFNNAIRIRKGHVGDTKVDGLKFWLSGDLGDNFADGEMKSAVLTYDQGTTPAQKEAIQFLVGKLYPVKWSKIQVDEQPIFWERKGSEGVAMLGDGTIAKVELKGVVNPDGKIATIRDLTYWGAQKNDGFELAKSVHHYKGNGFDYALKNKNGFFITVESHGDM